ncbi:serine/arginine-rich SC35-like splicing factor SCL33 isoform X1 [Cucumis melo var. makuwa]|uniref:Serine/arginine-rich SC35-like splicing factor SCL33 isoform X1 n=1 Tax=Cucumis melo var. makuwa TaxID=1194695 RepID=A0A5A7TQD2_CUCMM|nr:serine/arginine-rich SC35-like splicing factor SCL33 isoform X1 [Cucumis melo var. makuwa]TYK25372.1 serine/arginine-rich SC35-like splicing factor SCL33 isoform X1 [Cucumis melo var. makuwa]
MRGRSYSYSPSPPRSYGRRYRSPSPRSRGGRRRDLPTSLLVRNLRHDCRPEDLRGLFGRFGPLKDIYLPRDYYSGEPRGFGFVQFVDAADAADAKYELDGQVLLGHELTVVFAEENRKRPEEMRARDSSRIVSFRNSLEASSNFSYICKVSLETEPFDDTYHPSTIVVLSVKGKGSWVGPTVTAAGIHRCDIHDHHTMIENIHVVLSIIPLHGPDDIQGRLGAADTGSNPTQGHHMIQGAAVTAEAGAVAIAEVILGK